MADNNDIIKLFRSKKSTLKQLNEAVFVTPGRQENFNLRRNKGYYPGSGEEFVQNVKDVVERNRIKGQPTADSIRYAFENREKEFRTKPFRVENLGTVLYYGLREAGITVGKNYYRGYIIGFYLDDNGKPSFIFHVVNGNDVTMRLEKDFRTSSVKSIELF